MDKWTISCRACLSTSESFMYFLHENISPEEFWFCTSLEVKEDALPKSLCNGCYGLLTQFSEFKKLCIQSENILYNILKNFEAENKNCLNLKSELGDNVFEENFENNTVVKTEHLADIDDLDTNVCDDIYEEKGTKIYNRITKVHNSETRKKYAKPVSKLKKTRRKFKFTCELCYKKFGYRERFEAHKLEHEGKITAIYCAPCNKTFSTWGGLKRHNDCEHTRLTLDQLTCKLCSKVNYLKRHNDCEHTRLTLGQLTCKLCSKVNYLKRHNDCEHTRLTLGQLTCKLCSKVNYLKRHNDCEHTRLTLDQLTCKLCSKVNYLKRHNDCEHTRLTLGQLTCKLCSKVNYLKRHNDCEHTRLTLGQLTCKLCSKVNYLKRHNDCEHTRLTLGQLTCKLCSKVNYLKSTRG